MFTQRRWIWIFLVGTLFVGLFLAPLTAPVLAAEKELVWEKFDVDITVNTNGTFDVAEHQSIRFTQGDFTFGYRDIPKRNLSQITDWSVTDASGNVYQQAYGGSTPYTFVVEETGSSYVIRWYFPRTNDPETYTLGYTVHDGLRYYEGGDQVWWKAIYGDRQFPVLSGRVRVIVPSPALIQNYEAYIDESPAENAVSAELLNDNRVTSLI